MFNPFDALGDELARETVNLAQNVGSAGIAGVKLGASAVKATAPVIVKGVQVAAPVVGSGIKTAVEVRHKYSSSHCLRLCPSSHPASLRVRVWLGLCPSLLSLLLPGRQRPRSSKKALIT